MNFDIRVINRFNKETTNAGDVVYLPLENTYLWRGETVWFAAFDLPFAEVIGIGKKITPNHNHWLSDKPRIVWVIGNTDKPEQAQEIIDSYHLTQECGTITMVKLAHTVESIDKLQKGDYAITVTGEYLYISTKTKEAVLLYEIKACHEAQEIAYVKVEDKNRLLSQEPVIKLGFGVESLAEVVKNILSMPKISNENLVRGNKLVFRMANILKEMNEEIA